MMSTPLAAAFPTLILFLALILPLGADDGDRKQANKRDYQVVFPNAKAAKEEVRSALKFKQDKQPLKERRIGEFLLAYVGSTSQQWQLGAVKDELFDQLKPGLVPRELVKRFGPGFLPTHVGVSLLSWRSEDGRTLQVHDSVSSPQDLDKPVKYYIREYRTEANHAEVRELANKFIESIGAKDGQAWAVTSEDTFIAKAGVARTYKKHHSIQTREDKSPRITLTILEVKGDEIRCGYRYDPSPKGVTIYSDQGLITFRPKKRAK